MISQSRYINIVSGVGAGAGVAQRQFILRLITQNPLLPPGIVMEFSTADAVGAYFGQSSEEYKRAVPYFGFVSKLVTSPSKISFARWVSAAIAPMVVGDNSVKSLALLQAVTAGTMTVNDGGSPHNVTAIDLSTATSLTDVATLLQAELRAVASAPQLATCIVTFNTNTNQFVLTGTTTGAGTLTVTPTGTAADVAPLVGWGTSGTVYVAGQAADSADEAVANSANISNNFGSFAFCTPSPAMANADIEAVSAWNDSQNNQYIYSIATPLSNLAALFALVKGNSGTALNLISTTQLNDFVEQCPCEILAATDYDRANASQNYMYYQFNNRNITVSDDATADTADLSRGNYIGVTQSAGQQLAFYQRGVLCGGATDALDMNVYANEIWLKSSIAAQIMGLFLSSPRIPANAQGAASILGVLQNSIDAGKNNGTISSGKALTVQQQQFVTLLSGDENAWRQVANIGYWVNVFFTSATTPDDRIEWTANYTLIYSKDDAIRKVEGSNVLI